MHHYFVRIVIRKLINSFPQLRLDNKRAFVYTIGVSIISYKYMEKYDLINLRDNDLKAELLTRAQEVEAVNNADHPRHKEALEGIRARNRQWKPIEESKKELGIWMNGNFTRTSDI